MAMSFTIYTLQFVAKSVTCEYGIYADAKSESVVLKVLKSNVLEFMQA